jgi:subtilisin family serine protease
MANYLISLSGDMYDGDASAQTAITDAGASVVKSYNFNLTYLISATGGQLGAIPGVVEAQDADASVNATMMADVNTDQLKLSVDLSNQVAYNPAYSGTGQHVYLVDTGIDAVHTEFASASINNLYSNFSGDAEISEYGDEIAGHGTAIASLIVGAVCGAATAATLHNVKLFADGVGTLTVGQIVDALEAILVHHNANTPSQVKVVCMPWTIPQNSFIDAKILEMDASNLLVVCAAGNAASDVEGYSPAGVNRVLTVGSFNRNLEVSNFTNTPWGTSGAIGGYVNFGAELDIFALGVDVDTALAGTSSGYSAITGTSAACGTVAGIATHYIERYTSKTSDQLKDVIMSEGHFTGQTALVFDTGTTDVDYSSVYKSMIQTENVSQAYLTTAPSGRIINVQSGTTGSVSIGINPAATDVAILDFAPAPAWISVDLSTGTVSVDADAIGDAQIVPGAVVFAIKGIVDGETLVEEFSVGVYATAETELDDAASYYYDATADEYDAVVSYQVAGVQKP